MSDILDTAALFQDDVPPCPGQHCSRISDRINETCKRQGHSGDRVYLILADGSECWCKCSCAALNTPVAVATGKWMRIQDFEVGDTVLTATRDRRWTAKEVKFSDGTLGDGTQVPGAIYIKTTNNIELIVTADHPFLLADGHLQQAHRLTKTDKLMSADFSPVGIKLLAPGLYAGGIWNISTTTSNAPGEPLEDHLINMAGIISGDFYAQLYLVEGALLKSPAIGTTEYSDRNTSDRIEFDGRIAPTGIDKSQFVPYRKFTPPPGAVSLLPDYMTKAKPGMLRPLDDSLSLENAEYVAWLFKRIFGQVDIHVREYWDDDTVNAYAWKEGSQRHVALLGGLIRHVAIQKEGLALVTAHEIGHHYGGAPTYPGSDLSCEGQADYWATWIGMRDVFPGTEYYRWTRPGIDQLHSLFSSGLLIAAGEEYQKALFDRTAGCGHPPADCRKETYLAGMRLDPKPSCASLTRRAQGDPPAPTYDIVRDDRTLCQEPADATTANDRSANF